MEANSMTRPEFIHEMIKLMKTHEITLEQLMYLYTRMYQITYKDDDTATVMLWKKNLLKPPMTVNTNILFGKKIANQLKLNFTTDTPPKLTEHTRVLADNLYNTFVPQELRNEIAIKTVADQYFQGDIGVAEYYIIFRAMFPKKNGTGNNKLWNKHFGFGYIDQSKWTQSMVIVRKFTEVYLTKDVGIFLSGLYYYMRDSIDFDQGACYMTKPGKFLDSYDDWYELAETKLQKSISKKKKK